MGTGTERECNTLEDWRVRGGAGKRGESSQEVGPRVQMDRPVCRGQSGRGPSGSESAGRDRLGGTRG